MSKGSKIFLILVIIIVIVGAGFFIWKNESSKKINDNVLEMSVKKALIEIANDEYYKDVSNKEGTTAAEGHKILDSEIKDNSVKYYF